MSLFTPVLCMDILLGRDKCITTAPARRYFGSVSESGSGGAALLQLGFSCVQEKLRLMVLEKHNTSLSRDLSDGRVRRDLSSIFLCPSQMLASC